MQILKPINTVKTPNILTKANFHTVLVQNKIQATKLPCCFQFLQIAGISNDISL